MMKKGYLLHTTKRSIEPFLVEYCKWESKKARSFRWQSEKDVSVKICLCAPVSGEMNVLQRVHALWEIVYWASGESGMSVGNT